MLPTHCTIDFKTNLIYCLDNQESLISFHPVDRKLTTLRTSMPKWISMSVFDEHIIYTDYEKSVVGKFPTDPKKQDKFITLFKEPHPFDVKVFHSDIQAGKCYEKPKLHPVR